MKEYRIDHVKHGCYNVILVDESKDPIRYEYLTNFRNKRAANAFVKAHEKGEVHIDPKTKIPTPDFE
jgi:hypothetical protein